MQEEPKTSFLINFIVRAVVGMGLIFFVNQYLEYRGISLRVGLNGISFLTSGILGVQGLRCFTGYWRTKFYRGCTKIKYLKK